MEEPNVRLDQRSAPDYHERIAGSDSTQSQAEVRHRHGEELTAISDGLVTLLKEFYGRGPTQAKSYYQDDLVVCILRGGYTQVEQTLRDGGRGSAVIEQRMQFQELMRERDGRRPDPARLAVLNEQLAKDVAALDMAPARFAYPAS